MNTDWLEGDKKLSEEIKKMFVKKIPVQMERLRNAFSSCNISDVEIISHSIKGSAAMVGASGLRDEAYKIELAAVQKDIEKARSYLEGMERELKKTLQTL